MRNLTLASAKHLLTQGHITPAHHAKIVAAAGLPKMPTLPKLPKMQKAAPGGFGSLAKAAVGPMMQQGQAPIPGVSGGPPVIPPGLASGYEDQS
jgi:hypothetical protein